MKTFTFAVATFFAVVFSFEFALEKTQDNMCNVERVKYSVNKMFVDNDREAFVTDLAHIKTFVIQKAKREEKSCSWYQ